MDYYACFGLDLWIFIYILGTKIGNSRAKKTGLSFAIFPAYTGAFFNIKLFFNQPAQ
jgi:hypothetical protein